MADRLHCPRCTARAQDADLGPYRRSARRDDAPGDPVVLARRGHPAGVDVYACGGCGGHYVTYEAMIRLEAFGRGKSSPHEIARRAYDRARDEVTCAKCGGASARRKWGVEGLTFVDVCVDFDCRGVWLDESELEAISGASALTPPEGPASNDR